MRCPWPCLAVPLCPPQLAGAAPPGGDAGRPGVHAGLFIDTAAQLKPSQWCHVPAEPGCRPGVRWGGRGGTGWWGWLYGVPLGSGSWRRPGAAVPLWSCYSCRAWGPSREFPSPRKGTGPCWGMLAGYITPSPPTKFPGMVLAQWVGDAPSPVITGGLGENCPMASQTASWQGRGSGKTPRETGAEGQHPLATGSPLWPPIRVPKCWGCPWCVWVSPPRVGDIIFFFL